MFKNHLFIYLFLVPVSTLLAQSIGVGTATPSASAKLHINATDRGLLIPNVALTSTNVAGPITAPATSLLVYNTATAGTAPNDVTPGYYYNSGTSAAPVWTRLENGGNDWHLTGNSGTSAATNFIGTTDATNFIVKTAGSAAGNERMRVIGVGPTPGQVVVNNTGVFAGDVFSVYANNTTNGSTNSINNIIGTFAINGYASVNGTAVYGETDHGATGSGTAVWGNLFGTATTASSTSEAVWGTNNTAPAGTGVTAAVATGVRGESSGAAGTAFTMGVLGANTATAGAAYGVYGQTSSPNAMGVFGVNLNVSAAPAHGIQGQTGAIGSAAGIRGINTATAITTSQNGFGVRGTANAAPTGTGFVMGVRGDVAGATGSTYGVYGQAASANGFGMDAVNTDASGTGLLVSGNNATGTFLTAGSGAAINGTATGTLSIAKTAASGTGVMAVGNNLTASMYSLGVGSGLAGTGTQFGVVGFATTTVNTNPLNNSGANGANASAGGYFEVLSAGVTQTWAYVGVRDNTSTLRKIIGPGTVNTIVEDTKGNLVALTCPEAPENLFEDYGKGQLVNGVAHINIDPIFAKNIIVNEQHELRVFVQLEGDCNGVYVYNKTGEGFDVKELANGSSNTKFTYHIVANRADEVLQDGSVSRYSAERFPAAPAAQTKIKLEAQTENMATRTIKEDAPAEIPQNLQKSSVRKREVTDK
ncbi:MAG: beta strand repeat-containing protein [Bacteroidia bacterium]